MFGHETAYTVGEIAGSVTGPAAQIVIANAAAPGSGLLACGSWAKNAAGLYTEFTTAAGVVAATQHLYNGTAGIGDALAFLPVVSYGIGSLGEANCFVAGTDVLEENPQGSSDAPVDTQIQNVKVGDEVLTRDQNNPNAPL